MITLVKNQCNASITVHYFSLQISEIHKIKEYIYCKILTKTKESIE